MDAFLLMTTEYNRKHNALVSEPLCVLQPNQLVLCVRPLVDVITCKQSHYISCLRCTHSRAYFALGWGKM